MPSLLSRPKPTLTADTLAARRQEAERNLYEAEAEYGRAALAFAEQQPDAGKALTAAQDAVTAAKAGLAALDRAKIELEAAERERADDATRKAREKTEARIKALAKERADAARKLTETLRDYVGQYDTWLAADEALRATMATAPHLRDVFGISAREACGRELARLSYGRNHQLVAPGAALHALLIGETIQPLVEACEAEAKAIFGGGR